MLCEYRGHRKNTVTSGGARNLELGGGTIYSVKINSNKIGHSPKKSTQYMCVCKYKLYKLFAKLHPCLTNQYHNVIIEVLYELFYFLIKS